MTDQTAAQTADQTGTRDTKWSRLESLIRGVFAPPPGRGRIALAWTYGVVCHTLFGVAVLAMIAAMFFGMSQSLGRVPAPWDLAANAFLLLQFPLVHSLLLTRRGGKRLHALAPRAHGRTLATTTYAIVSAVQLLLLFAFWTPSGIIWWEAEGTAFTLLCIAYASAWALLIKAVLDSGAELQSGALGWMSLAANKAPRFPDMPTSGTFAIIRQPIYVAFALATWLVPVWTPDQLVVALSLTAYCLAAPILKERRFKRLYGARFTDYQTRVPYALPRLWRTRDQ